MTGNPANQGVRSAARILETCSMLRTVCSVDGTQANPKTVSTIPSRLMKYISMAVTGPSSKSTPMTKLTLISTGAFGIAPTVTKPKLERIRRPTLL